MPHRKTLSDLINPGKLISLPGDAAAALAARKMMECQVGAVVVQSGGKLLGIVTERDYARKVVLMGRSSADTPVWQIMSSPVTTIGPEATVHECLELMSARHIRHLPVVDHGRVVGMLSIGDCVKAVIDEQKHHIEDLERVIRS